MAENPARGGRDCYPTPFPLAEWAIKRLLKLIPKKKIYSAIEPGCGDHAPFMGALTERVKCQAVGLDLNQGALLKEVMSFPIFTNIDFIADIYDACWKKPDQKFDIIATNPPFSICEKFIEKSFNILHPTGVMVYLLRTSVVGSKKRKALWKRRPPAEIATFVRRPSFDDKGTDYTEYACFFWYGEKLEATRKEIGKGGTFFYWVDNTREGIKENGGITEFGAPDPIEW